MTGSGIPMPVHQRWVFRGFYLLLGLTAAASIGYPMGPDQASFAVGADILTNGGMPFRDVWEIKGPACHLTYAVAHLCFGRNMWGIRILDLVLLGLSMGVLWRYVKETANTAIAHTAVLFFAFTYLNLGYLNTAQPDGWAGMALLAAFCLPHGPGKHGRIKGLCAGILVALATQYKFIYAAFLFPLAGEKLWTRNAGGLAAICGGFLLTTALCLIWLAWGGALGDYLEAAFGFARSVHAIRHPSNIGILNLNIDLLLIYRLFLVPFGNILPFAFLGFLVGIQTQITRTISLAGFWLIALAMVVIQGRYNPIYQWVPVYGPTVLLAGGGLFALSDKTACRKKGDMAKETPAPWIFAVQVILVATAAFPAHRQLSLAAAHAAGKMSRPAYLGHFDLSKAKGFRFSLTSGIRIARYIESRTKKTDTLLVWGFQPGIYYLSGRRPASRFIFNYPLTGSRGTVFFQRYRNEFMTALRRRPPLYVVVADNDRDGYILADSKDAFEAFGPLFAFVQQGYDHETTIGGFDIYRRRESCCADPS